MARNRVPLPDDIKQLLDLVQKGKLFALQEWIKSGKRLNAPDFPDTNILILAVKNGFHSMVEELLRAGGWTQEDLADALDWALENRRGDTFWSVERLLFPS